MAGNVSVMLSTLVLIFAQVCTAVLDADPLAPNPFPAFRMLGSQIASNLSVVSDFPQEIFGRQSCAQGYSQCGMSCVEKLQSVRLMRGNRLHGGMLPSNRPNVLSGAMHRSSARRRECFDNEDNGSMLMLIDQLL